MRSPFPGMNPYLERPSLWPDVHLNLIHAVQLLLTQALAPHYYVAAEERTYIAAVDPLTFVGRPDVAVVGTPITGTTLSSPTASSGPIPVLVPVSDEVRERYLEIRESRTDRVITVIEILSPTNKLPGQGRANYEEKRRIVLDSATHLVEIDLLRLSEPLPAHPLIRSDYRVLVSRSWERPRSFLYSFQLPDPIPDVPVPLQQGEDEPLLRLNPLLHQIYAEVRYDLRIDYTASPPDPSLDAETLAWVDQLLRRAGVRHQP
jgi:hypothetical protein